MKLVDQLRQRQVLVSLSVTPRLSRIRVVSAFIVLWSERQSSMTLSIVIPHVTSGRYTGAVALRRILVNPDLPATSTGLSVSISGGSLLSGGLLTFTGGVSVLFVRIGLTRRLSLLGFSDCGHERIRLPCLFTSSSMWATCTFSECTQLIISGGNMSLSRCT